MIQQIKQREFEVSMQYYRLCASQDTSSPEFDEDFIVKVNQFLKDILEVDSDNLKFREGFYWLSHVYHVWYQRLQSRGALSENLPSSLPKSRR